jgi:LPXTG-site transpeptidase (sortase) family protein
VKLANYKNRIIDKKIDLYLETFGAILIEGPKWCGKTWTSMYHSNSEFLLANPNGNFNNKKLAQLNPDLILDGISPRLIDEWQEVPMVWDAVRGRVDANPNKGLFILTGSASVNKNDYIHSGTGRIAFFKNFYKLSKGDKATIYYKGKKYDYVLNDIYDVPKTGSVKLKKIETNKNLILITCTYQNKKMQSVYVFKLISEGDSNE